MPRTDAKFAQSKRRDRSRAEDQMVSANVPVPSLDTVMAPAGLDFARYVGRIGALAVALGVGAVVGSAIANAEPSGSAGSSSSAVSNGPARPSAVRSTPAGSRRFVAIR